MLAVMRSNVVELRQRAGLRDSGATRIAACEEELFRAHNEAIAQICISLDQHVEIHQRMLNLMTESARKQKALAELHVIALASNFIRLCR